ncbi:Alpha subunit of chaperonin-containing T-complex [Phytophthora pseudosyringae]|uniref:Alpha subunit of chaperonin-containing T-complex n=1 Tax=Phytophthora pseudosyringae TaxID=221518 RepID=A0A8T1V375_9STRA|nr:Alpha subunit of chaperonin-containing T-complex [Phytophthora pseudosyringae]
MAMKPQSMIPRAQILGDRRHRFGVRFVSHIAEAHQDLAQHFGREITCFDRHLLLIDRTNSTFYLILHGLRSHASDVLDYVVACHLRDDLRSRTLGKDVREQNVTAAVAIADIVKSSLGHVGIDKKLVDHIGEVTISNDGATILKNLEVEQTAGKLLLELTGLQAHGVGEGTTSDVIVASELLKRINELVKDNLHPTSSAITGR